MRLKSQIWVMAHIRRAFSEGAMATVIRKGDADAGAIYIRTLTPGGDAALYGPAPVPDGGDVAERYWRPLDEDTAGGPGPHDPGDDDGEGPPAGSIDRRLGREIGIDPDIWIVEIEDRQGRHFLGDRLQPA